MQLAYYGLCRQLLHIFLTLLSIIIMYTFFQPNFVCLKFMNPRFVEMMIINFSSNNSSGLDVLIIFLLFYSCPAIFLITVFLLILPCCLFHTQSYTIFCNPSTRLSGGFGDKMHGLTILDNISV